MTFDEFKHTPPAHKIYTVLTQADASHLIETIQHAAYCSYLFGYESHYEKAREAFLLSSLSGSWTDEFLNPPTHNSS